MQILNDHVEARLKYFVIILTKQKIDELTQLMFGLYSAPLKNLSCQVCPGRK